MTSENKPHGTSAGRLVCPVPSDRSTLLLDRSTESQVVPNIKSQVKFSKFVKLNLSVSPEHS